MTGGALHRRGVVAGLLGSSFALLFLVGLAGPSAAKPPLGPRGWAPGELAWAPSSALVTALLWAAYLLGAAGVAAHLAGRPLRIRWYVPVGLAVLALLTGPFGSPDHTVYAAYGRIAGSGGDPYLLPPDAALPAGDPLLALVDDPWQGTVSIYGPVATLLQAAAALVGGDSMRQVVWVWQVVCVLAWLAVRWLLLRRPAGARPGRVDALWTLNPLVFGVGVLGAHVDLVAAAFAAAALVTVARSPVLSGALAGLAVSTKATYGLVGVALVIALGRGTPGPGRGPDGGSAAAARRVLGCALAGLVVAGAAHWWAGPHVLDQLDRARDSVSFATPWRLLLEAVDGPLGGPTARRLVGWAAIGLFVVLAALLARVTRALAPASVLGTAARWTVVLAVAYALAAPYSLPWYDLLAWVALPLLAASALDLVVLGRLLAISLAYVPGRVTGMSATVRDLTLGFRRRAVPFLQLLVWVWLTLVAVSGWSRSRGLRPRAPAPPPR